MEGIAMKAAVLLVAGVLTLGAQTGATVEGRVVNSVTGQPVKRAMVVLHGAETYLCRTDGEGRFTVKGVAAGRYQAEATHDGYQAKPQDSPLTFEAGQHATGVELRLIPLGVIWGRVVDETGEPVARAVIDVLENRYNAGKRTLFLVKGLATDDRGEYRFSGLAPGSYYLRASRTDQDPPLYGDIADRGPGRQRVFTAAYYDGARDLARASSLVLRPGGELGHVDIQIRHAMIYSIRGRAPAGYQVALGPRAGEPGGAYATRRSRRDNQSFEIAGLPPGSYTVRAGRNDPDSRQTTLYAMRRVEITDNDVEGVDLTNPTAVEIAGEVRTAAGAVTVLAPLRVVLEPEVSGPALRTTAIVKDDGTFTISGHPDRYYVRMEAPDGTYLKSVKIGDRAAADHRLNPGSDTGRLTLSVATDTGRISGIVTDDQGAPAARAAVTLIPDQSLPFWADLARTATADTSGSFAIRNVVPGDYRLFAWSDAESGAPFDVEFRKAFEARGEPVRVDPGGGVVIKLTSIRTAGSR
jgi:hypothetical protein